MSPYSYKSSNQLTTTPSATFAYDANGNTSTKVDASGTTTYTWDFENHLSSVGLSGTSGTVTFKYDPFGRRTQKSSSNGTTNYLYDGNNTVEEIDGTGTELTHYAQGAGIDEPLAALRGGTTGFYEQDGLGSVTSLTDSTGVLLNSYTYDSFGNLTVSTGFFVNPYQFTGRDYDSKTGLRYYRARYYDPKVGRFLSEDPLGFKAGRNFYRYTSNNPLRFTDPSGLVIVVNGTPQQTQDYLAAVAYLKADGGMAAVIQDLENSKTVYNVNFNNNDDDSFDPITNVINWDPYSGCTCTSGGIQSPALGLGHEMGHADAPGLGNFLVLIKIFAGNYDNWEERRVITGLETEAARTLGEPIRPDHRCAGTPRVATPIFHTPVVYPAPPPSLTPYQQYVLSLGPH
jgi:RHS repeat-associated protein